MSFTSPGTEPFPPFNDHDYQDPAPRMARRSPRTHEDATKVVDGDKKRKSHTLNPAAMEFVSPTRTSGIIPANVGGRITTPLQLSPVVQLPTQAVSPSSKPSPSVDAPTSTAEPENTDAKKEGQSATEDFASPSNPQKSTADSTIPADKTGHAEERSDPTKKPANIWTKYNQSEKVKSHASQGSQSTNNDHDERGQKDSGKKTKSSSGARPASHANDKADKQQQDDSQTQKQDQAGKKDAVPKGSNAKGKPTTKEVPANRPVVPGATWVETEPKKASKKKSTKRHAPKGKTTAKSAGSSVTSAPTLSQEPEIKGEQDSGSQATNGEGGSDNKSKGNRKAEAQSQDGSERAVTPIPKDTSEAATTAPTGTAAEAKKPENPETQSAEAVHRTSKEPATKKENEKKNFPSKQAKKSKGKKQKSSAANQNAASQDKDQATPSAATQATTNEKAEVDRRDTMVSLSQADLPSVFEENNRAGLTSSGTKTPSLRDAPAPNNSPWRKDGKNKASYKNKEESTDVHPETLLEGEERKGG
ncbi:hypothetical protein PG985_012281 [Apiospora marii]|uniref:Uncharacterized protein n=1 Tax=Apiospora marii TaxID=335849 RepID=A0ABR1RDQ8_9PEZI